jgi:hypothetical protein
MGRAALWGQGCRRGKTTIRAQASAPDLSRE